MRQNWGSSREACFPVVAAAFVAGAASVAPVLLRLNRRCSCGAAVSLCSVSSSTPSKNSFCRPSSIHIQLLLLMCCCSFEAAR